MPIGGCGQLLAQSLGARLADMQRSPDGSYRGNTISCQFSREHDCGLLSKRIGHRCTIVRARLGRRLRVTDDHHQQFMRPDERDRRPRGHSGAADALAQSVDDVRSQRRNNARPE